MLFGSAWVSAWWQVRGNQWLTNPDVYYEWWEFLFFWDNASAWLWATNFASWLILEIVLSVVWGFIVALIIVFGIMN